jgi:hypothetical protein
MKFRCSKKYENNKDYKYYGGRGISVCPEWENDPVEFYNWCIENGWKKGLQIDRIDNDGNYEPGNCRFVTTQENNLNKRLLQSRNKSGFAGVSFDKKFKNYVVGVSYKNKRIFRNHGFKTAKDAAIARDIFCIKNDLPLKLNFPELKYWSSL